MRVVGLDPGKKHFAYAVLQEGRCIDRGAIRPIDTLQVRAINDQLIRFSHDVNRVLDNLSCHDWLAFERMQHRPNLGGGAVVEYINLMLGIVIGAARERHIQLYPVMSTTWKSCFVKRFGIERQRFTMVGQKLTMRLPAGSKHKTRREFCAGLLDGQARSRNLTPHEGDAVGIACYCHEQLTGLSVVEHALV